jgi:hypothetical protein
MDGFMPTHDATKCKKDPNYVKPPREEFVAPDETTNTCEDMEGWVSATGDNCDVYVASEWCNLDGSAGPGWDPLYGTFAEWGDGGGVDATGACCACGGGATAGDEAATDEAVTDEAAIDYVEVTAEEAGDADAEEEAAPEGDIFHFEEEAVAPEEEESSYGSMVEDVVFQEEAAPAEEVVFEEEEEAAPAEEAAEGSCADTAGWVSSTDFGCDEYATYAWCTADGGFGEGWDPELGDFSQWASTVDGTDATQACCVCGGGSSGGADPSAEAVDTVEVADAAPAEASYASYAAEEETLDAAPAEEEAVEAVEVAEEAVAACVDQEGWESSSGFACDEYVAQNWCADGAQAAGWDEAFGTFQDWATDGVDATQACCACGRTGDSRRALRGKKH